MQQGTFFTPKFVIFWSITIFFSGLEFLLEIFSLFILIVIKILYYANRKLFRKENNSPSLTTKRIRNGVSSHVHKSLYHKSIPSKYRNYIANVTKKQLIPKKKYLLQFSFTMVIILLLLKEEFSKNLNFTNIKIFNNFKKKKKKDQDRF